MKHTSILRDNVKFNLDNLLRGNLSNLTDVNKDGIYKSCINCLHFEKTKLYCKKFKQHPPAEIIVFSCEGYFDIEEIPF